MIGENGWMVLSVILSIIYDIMLIIGRTEYDLNQVTIQQAES
jgi:hypothetical protein